MSDMVERVAEVLFDYSEPGEWSLAAEGVRDIYRGRARAAIKAMMEPTETMIGALWADKYDLNPEEAYLAALTAALED